MLAPRPTKLRSQRDINLWRIPLQLSLAAVGLFAITLIPDILDKYGVIHIPSGLTRGSIDDARAILSAMTGAVATVLALIFSVALLVLSMVSTLFGPRSAVPRRRRSRLAGCSLGIRKLQSMTGCCL
jgi:uncharacterized membrane protein